MAVNRDFSDLFAALNALGAKYLVVGAYAVAWHGEPRFTKDLDVWIGADAGNAERVYRALLDFGAPVDDLSAGDLATPGIVFQMGLPPNRIDLLTSIDGVEFDNAWERRVATQYGDQPVFVIGLDDLLLNKRTSGRPQDLVDLALLRRQSGH
jgi:hypothetical protein